MHLWAKIKMSDVWFPEGWGRSWGKGRVREFGMDMYTWITKGLLYSTGNSAQCCVCYGGACLPQWLRMRGVGVPEARSGFDSFSAVLAAHTSVPLVSLW